MMTTASVRRASSTAANSGQQQLRVVHLVPEPPGVQSDVPVGEDALALLPALIEQSSLLMAPSRAAARWWQRRLNRPVSSATRPSWPLTEHDALGVSLRPIQPAIVHAWGVQAGWRALLCRGSRASCEFAIVVQMDRLPTAPELLHLRAILGSTRTQIATTSPRLLDALRHAFPAERLTHLPASFPSRPPQPAISADPHIAVLPLPSRSVHIKHVLWAGAIVRQLYPNLRLRVLDTGPHAQVLQRFASRLYCANLVEFLATDVAGLLAGATLAVVAHDDAMSSSAALARAHAVPTLVTDASQPPRQVAGHLLRALDAAAPASVITELSITQLGGNSRSYATLYESLAGAPPGR